MKLEKSISGKLQNLFCKINIKNCSYFLLLNSFLAAGSCSNKLPTDPLLVPPEFDVLPTQAEIDGKEIIIEGKSSKTVKETKTQGENDKSIQELKGLLLD